MRARFASFFLLFGTFCFAETTLFNQEVPVLVDKSWLDDHAPDSSDGVDEELSKNDSSLLNRFQVLASAVRGGVLNPKFDGDEPRFRPEILRENERDKHWINPFTAICWRCFFPIHFAGYRGSPYSKADEDFVKYKKGSFWSLSKFVCACKERKQLGVPIAFWEPMMLLEVTPTPYKFPCMGGAVFKTQSFKNRGSISNGDSGRTSFHNVHYIPFPIFRILGLLPGFTCLKKLDPIHKFFWLTEWDPLWRNPSWAAVLSPNMLLHADPKSAAECIKDCKASNARKPSDGYPWCAGCLGSYYPFVGHVAHHVGSVQASYLLVHRALGRLHSIGLGRGFEADEYCKKKTFLKLKKTSYKTQLIHPVPDLGDLFDEKDPNSTVYCRPLGASDAKWGAEKCIPNGGEDFVYLVWNKMQCCYDLADVVVSIFFPKLKAAKEAGQLETLEQIEEFIDQFDQMQERLNKFNELGIPIGDFLTDAEAKGDS